MYLYLKFGGEGGEWRKGEEREKQEEEDLTGGWRNIPNVEG